MDAPFPAGMVEEWRDFLANDRTPPGLGVYDAVFETGLCFPLQRKRELAWMLGQAARVGREECPTCKDFDGFMFAPCETCGGTGYIGGPRTVMEIGADKGGGLYHWCKLPTVRNVIACEIRGCPYQSVFEDQFDDRIEFLWLERGSTDPGGPNRTPAVKTVERMVRHPEGPGAIDVLFIDGDKTRMVEDFDAYLPLMNPRGVVFLHDVQDREPGRAFDALAARRRWRTGRFIDSSEYEELRERVGDVEHPTVTAWEQWLLHWRGTSCGVGAIYLGEEP